MGYLMLNAILEKKRCDSISPIAGRDKGIPFSKGFKLKENMTPWLEIELASFATAVQHINHE